MRTWFTTVAFAALASASAVAQTQAAPAPAPAQKAPPETKKQQVLPPISDVLPLPDATPALDLSVFLRDTSLCISPFVKETSTNANLDPATIQKTFFDVAKESSMLKDAVLLGSALKCDPRDAQCYQSAGKMARCQNVLVGASAAKGNGVVLSVRIFDVAKGKLVPGSEVEQVLESDKPAEVQAWAEGQACRALNVRCSGKLQLDVDRRDMLVYVDNRVAPRSFKNPEVIPVVPGVHAVRVAVGQRTSLEKKVVVRRNQTSEMVYARQTETGGLPLLLASELRGPPPGPSVDVQSKWTRPAGITVASVGLAVAAFGAYEGLHSKSLINQSNDRFVAQGNRYQQSDLATIDSARSAAKTANLLFVVGGVLLAAGLVTTFAF